VDERQAQLAAELLRLRVPPETIRGRPVSLRCLMLVHLNPLSDAWDPPKQQHW
jgi:hypothetical protein